MSNRLVDRFNLRYPICSAGMAMIATPELTAAVSNAGGMGILGSGPVPPEWLHAAIAEVRARADGPFAVNLINETTAFGPLTDDAHVQACIDAGVDLVVFFWQLPERRWLDALRAAGVPWWVTVGDPQTVDAAMSLRPDGVILQGTQAGGHVRSAATVETLIDHARAAYPDALLIGAGGLADAGDIRRVLERGADGVCLGTRFVASAEANAHPEYQRRIVAARAADTVMTTVFGPEWPDVPMRVIANKATRGEAGAAPVGTTKLFGQIYEMPPASAVLPMRETVGDFDAMCLAAGESVERIDAVRPAVEIVRSLFDGWWTA